VRVRAIGLCGGLPGGFKKAGGVARGEHQVGSGRAWNLSPVSCSKIRLQDNPCHPAKVEATRRGRVQENGRPPRGHDVAAEASRDGRRGLALG
jgi:hypothetical protein